MVSSNNEIIPGMTIGPGNLNRFIIINSGHRAFESRNPGAMYVSLSRAKTSGTATELANFAFHSNELLNHDRVCHKPSTPLLLARDKEVARIQKTSATTMGMFPHLRKENPFLDKLPHTVSRSSERLTTRPAHFTIHSTLRKKIHYPANLLQPGPIFFKTPRKMQFFAVHIEGISRQMNYIIDEASTSGKRANVVISFLEN